MLILPLALFVSGCGQLPDVASGPAGHASGPPWESNAQCLESKLANELNPLPLGVEQALGHIRGVQCDGTRVPIDYERALTMIYRYDDASPQVRRVREKVESMVSPEVVMRTRREAWDSIRPLEAQSIGAEGGEVIWEFIGPPPVESEANRFLSCRKAAAEVLDQTWDCAIEERHSPDEEGAKDIRVEFVPLSAGQSVVRLSVFKSSYAGFYRVDLEEYVGKQNCPFSECVLWFVKRTSPVLPTFVFEFGPGKPPTVEDGHALLRVGAVKEKIDEFREKIEQEPHCRIRIEGSADSVGEPEKNLALAGRRALSLRDELMKGQSADDLLRFEVVSLGETRHANLGIDGFGDGYVRTVTARFVNKDGSECTPLAALRRPGDVRPIGDAMPHVVPASVPGQSVQIATPAATIAPIIYNE